MIYIFMKSPYGSGAIFLNKGLDKLGLKCDNKI